MQRVHTTLLFRAVALAEAGALLCLMEVSEGAWLSGRVHTGHQGVLPTHLACVTGEWNAGLSSYKKHGHMHCMYSFQCTGKPDLAICKGRLLCAAVMTMAFVVAVLQVW